MKLELNLVKIRTIDSNVGKLLSRQSFDVQTDTDAINSIIKFIGDNISNITAVVSDKTFVAKLQQLQSLTIPEFQCLRYILAQKGLDIWYWYFNGDSASDISSDVYEYNVVDPDSTNSFVPLSIKYVQTSSNASMVKLYTNITEAFRLFGSPLFEGMLNPIKNMIEAMRNDEEAVGMVSGLKTQYVNSMLEFLNKRIQVITD